MLTNERIGFIELEKKAEQMLSFPMGQMDELCPRIQLDFIHLSNGDAVPLSGKKGDFFAPLLVLDKVNQVYYPVFFFLPVFSRKDGEPYVSLSDEKPERNNRAKEFLRKRNLIEKGNVSFSSLESFVNTLSGLIDSLRLADRVSFAFSYSFFSKEALLYHSIYPFLLLGQPQQRKEDKYRGLFQEVKEEEKEKVLNQENVGYFSKQERSLLRREQYKASEVSYDEQEVADDILFRAVLSARKKNHSVLLVVPEKEREGRDAFLSCHHLQNDVRDLNHFSFQDKKRLLKDNNESSFFTDGFSLWEQRFESFESKRQDCFVYPSFFRSEKRKEFLFKKDTLESFSYPMDATSYSSSDVEKDNKVRDEIKERESLLSVDIQSHPFFGLDSNGEKDKYQDLQSLLSQRKEIRNQILLLIHTKRNSYYKLLNTFDQLTARYEERKFVERYDGFSLQMFSLSANQSQQYPLSNLKKRFQAVSSIKLIVKDFFDDSVFSSDILNRVKEAESTSYFERRKGRKRIRKYLKNKKKPDYDSLVKRLSNYWKNYSLLQKNRPMYRKIYGENVATRSYVTESETRRNYVHEFEEREKKNPSFSFKNEFIYHLYQDGDYRREFLLIVHSLEKLTQEFLDLSKEYRFFFPQEERDCFPLQECSRLIEKRRQGSYDDFSDFSFFHKERMSASYLRQKTRKEQYILMHRPLLHFKEEFFHSIYLSLYQAGKERFTPYQKDYSLLLSERTDQAKKGNEEEDSYLLSLLHENQRNNQKEVRYRDRKMGLVSSKVETLLTDVQGNPLFSLFSKRYPICLASPLDLSLREDNCFDEVILLNSKFRKDVSLINGIRVGKSVLLLSPVSLLDNRIQGLHYTYLSNDGIYRKVIDFQKIPENLLDLFKNNQKKYDYILDTSDSRYPYRIKKQGWEDLGLFPSLLLPQPEDRQGRNELNRYLNRQLGFSLFYFHIEDALFDTDSFFDCLFGSYSKFAK